MYKWIVFHFSGTLIVKRGVYMLELRKLEYKDKESLIRYLQYWYDNNEKIIPSNIDVAHYQSFEQMVEQLHHPPVNMNTVPSTTLFYFKNDDIVGAVNIRHELNDKLKISEDM